MESDCKPDPGRDKLEARLDNLEKLIKLLEVMLLMVHIHDSIILGQKLFKLLALLLELWELSVLWVLLVPLVYMYMILEDSWDEADPPSFIEWMKKQRKVQMLWMVLIYITMIILLVKLVEVHILDSILGRELFKLLVLLWVLSVLWVQWVLLVYMYMNLMHSTTSTQSSRYISCSSSGSSSSKSNTEAKMKTGPVTTFLILAALFFLFSTFDIVTLIQMMESSTKEISRVISYQGQTALPYPVKSMLLLVLALGLFKESNPRVILKHHGKNTRSVDVLTYGEHSDRVNIS